MSTLLVYLLVFFSLDLAILVVDFDLALVKLVRALVVPHRLELLNCLFIVKEIQQVLFLVLVQKRLEIDFLDNRQKKDTNYVENVQVKEIGFFVELRKNY